MASYAVAADEIAKHATLVADTVDTVTFTANLDEIEVVNRDGAAALYFTLDGSTPAAGGARTYAIPSAGSLIVSVPTGGATVVKVISAGTPTYSVTRPTRSGGGGASGGGGGDSSAANQALQLTQETNTATSLAILDDWDETDRAKVNLIAGQAGITAGAGAVAANTPRVTLASDGPFATLSGAVTETAPASDTASSGINGRLQRIAQRLTSLIALVPTALAGNGGLKVELASALSSSVDSIEVIQGIPIGAVYKDWAYNDTSARAAASAAVVIDPTSGKKIAITDITISTYGTTAGKVILFFADDADLTYTAGTDQVLEIASFAPSATSHPGMTKCYAKPVKCATADRQLHYQNTAAISLDIVLHGYEF